MKSCMQMERYGTRITSSLAKQRWPGGSQVLGGGPKQLLLVDGCPPSIPGPEVCMFRSRAPKLQRQAMRKIALETTSEHQQQQPRHTETENGRVSLCHCVGTPHRARP